MTLEAPTTDDRIIWDLWLSAYLAPAMSAADELHLFEALDARPATAAELAEAKGWNGDALKTLLPLLASMGLLSVRVGRYHLTDVARTYLLHEGPFYWGHAFPVLRAIPHHGQLTAAVTAGPDASKARSRPVDSWESGQLSADMARMLTAFMHSHSLPAALSLARSAAFDGIRRLLDVGGGSGCFSIALADRRPDLRATVMELPAVCALAAEYIAAAGLSARVDTIVVDMFRQAWPEGYDAIFMSNIFHDWDEETCARLAARAYSALPPGGRFYLHEMLIDDDGAGPVSPAAFSAMMLVGTQGRQYSAAELSALLQDARFADVTITEAHGHFSLVCGHKR